MAPPSFHSKVIDSTKADKSKDLSVAIELNIAIDNISQSLKLENDLVRKILVMSL
jgi:hypothetical protein